MMGCWKNSAILLAVLLSKAFDSSAFTKPIQLTRSSLAVSTKWDSAVSAVDNSKPITDLDGEQSRLYRRTVYTHDDWVRHRAPTRFIRNFSTILNSVIYKSVGKEVLATTAVATFICVWNSLAGGYTDLAGVQHAAIIPDLPLLGLPLTPFTLVTSSLGLLLVFRTNTSYTRWDEARKFWGLNINHTRDLMRMGVAWYGHGMPPGSIDPEQRKEDLNNLSLATWAFVRSMKRHLSPVPEDEEAFRAELRERLGEEKAAPIIAAAHRPNRALTDLSNAIEVLPMNFLRKNQMHTALSIFEDTLGGSERLLSSPVPLFYSRHTARFLLLWLLLLPFALWEPFKGSWNHLAMIPSQAAIAVALFGIEELATQLEEPFTILPMQGFCDKIGNWCNEIATWPSPERGTSAAQVNGYPSEYAVASPPAQYQPVATPPAQYQAAATPQYEPVSSIPPQDAPVEKVETEYDRQYRMFLQGK